jgi:hypothetical protein
MGVDEKQIDDTTIFRLCMLNGNYDFMDVEVRHCATPESRDEKLLVFKCLDDLRYFLINANNSGFGSVYSMREDKLEMYAHYPHGGHKEFMNIFSRLPGSYVPPPVPGAPVKKVKPYVRPEPDMSFADDW